MPLISEPMGRGDRARCSPASSVLMVSSLLGSLRPILLKEYMRMLYTEAGCKSTMLAWLMVGEMLRVDCLKSQESGERTPTSNHSQENSRTSLQPQAAAHPKLNLDTQKRLCLQRLQQENFRENCSVPRSSRDQGMAEHGNSKSTTWRVRKLNPSLPRAAW